MFDAPTIARLNPPDMYNLAICTTHPDFVLDYIHHLVIARANMQLGALPVALTDITGCIDSCPEEPRR